MGTNSKVHSHSDAGLIRSPRIGARASRAIGVCMRLGALASAAVMSVGCSSRHDVSVVEITGAWAIGPASGGSVAIYTVDADGRGDDTKYSDTVVAEADGSYALRLERVAASADATTGGDFRVCVSPTGGATYEELATGDSVALSHRLCANMVGITAEPASRTVAINPMTTWVAVLTDAHVRLQAMSVREASAAALSEIEAWLDCLGEYVLVPALPHRALSSDANADANADASTNDTEAQTAGQRFDASLLVYGLMGGFSEMAATLSRSQGAREHGFVVTSSDLVGAVACDLSDVMLNGIGDNRRCPLFEGYEWSRDSLRVEFIDAVHRFLLSERNQSFLTPQMLRPYLQCLGESALWGTPSAVKIEQPQTPSIRITSPDDGDVVSADRAVVARVDSDHPVSAMSLRASAGDSEIDLAAELTHDATGATANALLPVAQLIDGGDVVVSAAAVNTVGYRVNDSITLPVNMNAPSLTLTVNGNSLRPSGLTVAGAAMVRGEATDASGVREVALSLPVVGEVARAGGLVTVEADTTQWREGPHTLVLRGIDALGREARDSGVVYVDNNAAGIVRATLSLGATVRDAVVVATEFPSGHELGRAISDEAGRISLELGDPSDGHTGFILLAASGGVARDLIDDSDLPLQDGDALRAIVPYLASPRGTVLDNINLNLITTCAASLSEGYIAAGKRALLADNIDYAHFLFGDHLSASTSAAGILDARYVAVSDLSTDWSAATPFARRLALVHAGVAWDAARHAWAAGRDHREYSLLDHMHRLCARDLASLQFTGVDAAGALVRTVGNGALSASSFRHDLAAGIFHWLNGRLPSGAAFAANHTSLRGLDFAQRTPPPIAGSSRATDGFLHVLADNRSELFDRAFAPRPLDVDAPSLDVRVDATEVSDSEITVTVEGSDGDAGSGIARLVVTVAGATVIDRSDIGEGTTKLSVAIACNEANVPVVTTLYDRMGLASSRTVYITCDDEAPTLDISLGGVSVTAQGDTASDGQGEPLTLAGTIRLAVTAFDLSDVVELTATLPMGERIFGSARHLDVELNTLAWPEGAGAVIVTAIDKHGHRVERRVRVVVDNFAEGSLDLTVSLGAAVRGASVRVRQFPSGDELASGTTDDAGHVQLVIADTRPGHQGYLDVQVRGGSTADLMGGEDIALRSIDVLRTLLPYEATKAGTVITGANANFVSTCAAELADVLVEAPDDHALAFAVERAYLLFGDHLSRATSERGPLDARWVRPSDLTTDWSGDTPFRRRLGLVHAGVAWDAARHAWRAGRDWREYTLLDHMIRLCRRDLSSGRFSAMDADGATIATIGDEVLRGNSLRYDTAVGIYRWLDGKLPSGAAFAGNKTALRGSDFAQVAASGDAGAAGFLHTLSGTTNDLFAPSIAPLPFDAEPPTLQVTVAARGLTSPGLNVWLRADDGPNGTGVASIEVAVDGVVVDEIAPVPTGQFSWHVDIPCNRDDIRVRFTAVDGVGFTTTEQRVLACDDRKPIGGFLESSFSQEIFLEARYSEDGTTLTYEFVHDVAYNLAPEARAPGEPNIIFKFWDRLHAQSPNLPELSVWFTDTSRGGYSTPDESLRVSYEYLAQRYRAPEAVSVRGETALGMAGRPGHYRLPISYETLAPSVRQASPNDVHIIRFRARDRFNNTFVLDFRFHLVLGSAPVWFGGCAMTEALRARTLAANRTHELNGVVTDVGTGHLRYPVHSAALAEPLRVRVSRAPAFSLEPADLRLERGMVPWLTLREGARCANARFPVYWNFDTVRRGVTTCGPEYMGYGWTVNTVVDPSGPYGETYRLWQFITSPTVTMANADGVVMPQLPSDLSTFLIPVGGAGAQIKVNSGTTASYYDGQTYPWPEYALEEGNDSDISTRRYYLRRGYLNTTDTRDGTTLSEGAYIYLSRLRVSVTFPQLTASHPELPYVRIPVQVQPECTTSSEDWHEPIGHRW